MTQSIISVENLGKSYLVGHQSEKCANYTSLRDVVGRNVRSFGRKAMDMARGRQIIQGDEVEEFWALKDVSFEVNEGEVVGIIGRNGAGKSTLLKVLSRITEPTKGKVTLRGRVASLLEVGTGFHPELSGRENIFLNGAILGMTRVEIKNKFDEIVDFAGVEKFLDTPVKRYSSGMYVRLAFAVAAHLEPEILIVDEVLAVGDVEFQKKCLGKMRDVAAGGRTVLFVSHNLSSIQELSTRAILMNCGMLEAEGYPKDLVAEYLNHRSSETSKSLKDAERQGEAGPLRFDSISVKNFYGDKLPVISGCDVVFAIQYVLIGTVKSTDIDLVLIIRDSSGGFLFRCEAASQTSPLGLQLKCKTGTVSCRIPRLPLPHGSYTVELYAGVRKQCSDFVREALSIEVGPGDFYGKGQLPRTRGRGVLVDFEWFA